MFVLLLKQLDYLESQTFIPFTVLYVFSVKMNFFIGFIKAVIKVMFGLVPLTIQMTFYFASLTLHTLCSHQSSCIQTLQQAVSQISSASSVRQFNSIISCIIWGKQVLNLKKKKKKAKLSKANKRFLKGDQCFRWMDGRWCDYNRCVGSTHTEREWFQWTFVRVLRCTS